MTIAHAVLMRRPDGNAKRPCVLVESPSAIIPIGRGFEGAVDVKPAVAGAAGTEGAVIGAGGGSEGGGSGFDGGGGGGGRGDGGACLPLSTATCVCDVEGAP